MKTGLKTSLSARRGFRRRKESGVAALRILLVVVILVLGGAASYFIWQRSRPPRVPPLPPLIAVATPVPATPPPTTPEPVISKATPAPAPVRVAVTPPPVSTPPPLDLATVVRTPALWPAQVKLVQATTFPVTINGRVAGQAKVPAGALLRLLRVANQSYVEVEYQNARQFVPAVSTDLLQRALLAFQNKGSVLPQAPAAIASGPAPVPTATPAPSTAERLKVDVSVDRKRTDTGPAVATGEINTASDKYVYEVKVQNRAFTDIPALDVQYLIFVERQKLGERREKDTIDRITGGAKVEPLNRANLARTVSTSEIVLTRHSTDLYYLNGGRQKVADNVLGVWVKVFNEGKLIAEYTNPSTVTKRGWDKK